jgi:hypothetical protein
MNLTTETISKIATSLVAAQSSMGNAAKDAKNPFFKSKFADLNAIREAVIPVLNANGISVLQPTVPVDGKQFVKTMLLHASGEYICSLTEIVCAKQNDPQAYGSAVSYARRYGLQALVCVGAEDNDGEAAMGRTVAKVADDTPAKSFTAKAKELSKSTVADAVIASTVNTSETTAPKKGGWSSRKTNATETTNTKGDLY